MLKHFSKSLNSDPEREKEKKRSKAKGIYAKDSFDFLHLVRNWGEIVGENLSKNTSPLKIHFKSLIILTKHSIYSNELNFISRALLQKIFDKYPSLIGKINKIQFQTGSEYFKEKITNKEEQLLSDIEKNNQRSLYHPMSPEYQRLKAEAEEYLGHIDDPELRESMIKLFIQARNS